MNHPDKEPLQSILRDAAAELMRASGTASICITGPAPGQLILSGEAAQLRRVLGMRDEQAPTDKLRTIIAHAYQIAGAHGAPAHILDVLGRPDDATEAQIEAMLPYVPAPPLPSTADRAHPRYVEWFASRSAEQSGISFSDWLVKQPAEAAVAQACWSCKKLYTPEQRTEADGMCPHCGVEIELDVDGSEAAAQADGDPLDMHLPCDVTIGSGTIRKGCALRVLVLRAQGLHRMLMEHLPTPTADQRNAFDALIRGGAPVAAQGSNLTTVPCPCCTAGEACDECSGQGRIIVSAADLAAAHVLDEADQADSEGGHHD